MADALDHLAGPAGELLARVDDVLARFGSAGDDPVWMLLRRVRALPGEAVTALTPTLSAAPVAAAAATVRERAGPYADAQAALAAPVAWEGPAGEAFAAHAQRLARDLGDAADALAATARLADEVAAWIARTRSRLAAVLADALGSAEAVSVVLGLADAPRSASAIATRVLAAIDEAVTDGESLLHRRQVAGNPRPAALPPASYERITRLSF
ncbi:hypothetical protein DFJ67_1664 [Asanoa ferruginea]|uniref:Uncharacterized protein n=1 Tax=Asanoa ferruginea TaxID=53367 RepID=A0A3D9ZGT0_9ACTN|nr:hypothetical protein [Asanoa ferruginea]REF95704.1 hypothetical protein DFJ67_1664 [Asanoa ferruginea]GIF51785.1 hypothetical protein Afe04nite_63240 [Asanoa ferruginea]